LTNQSSFSSYQIRSPSLRNPGFQKLECENAEIGTVILNELYGVGELG
jgi:hypothetical protein